ncbi:MAG TPA: hypothetical protein VKA09_12175 [Nitrososphaeraceae archaeon]|nr:hypothetical protein [Nitrososphaeraceae archaeon]
MVTQLVNGRIEVIHAEEHDRPNFSDMIQEIWNIKNKCGYISNIYVDAANPEVWEALKREFSETYNELYMKETISRCKQYNLHIEDNMVVVQNHYPFNLL